MSMNQVSGRFFIKDSKILPNEEIDFTEVYRKPSIYEVIRLIDGTPLFYEDHFDRLQNSLLLSGHDISFKKSMLSEYINRLIDINKIITGNVKIVLNFNQESDLHIWTFFDIHHYPSNDDYLNGVMVKSLAYERSNPEAKMINTNLREISDQTIIENQINEIILIDRNGYITEGSRSNVFFIKDDEIHTPPLEQVLPGITRKKVFRICKELGLNLKEKKILLEKCTEYQSMFLTGTSRKVLPVQRFDQNDFLVQNSVLQNLVESFNQLVINYLSQNKK